MRRAMPLAILVSCLATGSVMAAQTGRTVERSYQVIETAPEFPQGGIRSSSTMEFRTRAHEHFVTVTVQDDSGLMVPATVTQDVDGDDTDDMSYDFCGSTEDPVAVEPGVPVKVALSHGSCNGVDDPSQYGGWTTGTVMATFTATAPKASAAGEPPHHH